MDGLMRPRMGLGYRHFDLPPRQYTLANYKFAKWVEPDNTTLQEVRVQVCVVCVSPDPTPLNHNQPTSLTNMHT